MTDNFEPLPPAHGSASNYQITFMTTKTAEELQRENEQLRERVTKLEREWLEEYRTVKLLIAAGIVTEQKAEQARELATSLR